MPLIVENGTIPKSEGYTREYQRRKFWRLSYHCYGPDYVNGSDGEGIPVIRRHERESEEDYARRKQTAVPWCFVGPIVRKYNDFVHRKPYDSDPIWSEFYEDVDTMGTPADVFMAQRLLCAQIDKVSYILMDTAGSSGTITNAQRQFENQRVFWRAVDADQVIQWKWFEGVLLEAAILMCDSTGQDFIWYVTPETVQRIDVKIEKTEIKIAAIGPESYHNWGGCPLVPVKPNFGGVSQAAPIAELQKGVTRERSLLDEELWNSTYSLMYITGAAKPKAESDIKFGPKQMLFLPNPQSSLGTVGGDPAQAMSIRQSIEDNTKEIMRVSGVDSGSAEAGQVESGLAKSFRFNDLAANLASLAKAEQDAHRRCERLTANELGISDYSYVTYPSDFTMPILNQELTDVISGLRSGLPRVLIDKLIQRFAQRNFDLSDEDKDTLEQQLADAGVLPAMLNQSARMS